jgi:hypothetical protein
VRAIAFSVIGCVVFAPVCFATPTQLYNKTITVSWLVESVQRLPDGRIVSPHVENQRTIYVSTAGRLFLRSTTTATNGRFYASKTADKAPGDSQIRFEGRRLIGNRAYSRGAGQMTIDFSPDFRSCTVSLIFGKEGGAPIRWKGLDGTIHEVISAKAVSSTCSIKEGNAFAGE